VFPKFLLYFNKKVRIGMANFNTHFAVGASVSAIISSSLLAMEVLEPNHAVVAFAIGTFGSLMPDIDSNSSKATGVGFTVVSLLITILFMFAQAHIYSIVEMLIMGGGLFITLRFAFIEVFRKFSRHRGIFHSIPMALIWGLITTILMYRFFGFDPLVAWIYGILMGLGYMVHLLLDEVYSVDLRNRRIKRSAGTAFKLFSVRNNMDALKYILLYSILVGLLMYAPDSSIVKRTLFSHDGWSRFIDVLLPNDGRWFIYK